VDERPLKAGGQEAFKRWVDKETYCGLPAYKCIYYIGVAQYSALILYRRRGGTEIDIGVVI